MIVKGNNFHSTLITSLVNLTFKQLYIIFSFLTMKIFIYKQQV